MPTSAVSKQHSLSNGQQSQEWLRPRPQTPAARPSSRRRSSSSGPSDTPSFSRRASDISDYFGGASYIPEMPRPDMNRRGSSSSFWERERGVSRDRESSEATLMNEGDAEAGLKRRKRPSLASTLSYRNRASIARGNQSRAITEHVEPYRARVHFILILAQALLTFGAPSHRIESQLESAAEILKLKVGFVHMPSLIICSFMTQDTRISEIKYVRASGRVALTSLHRAHLVWRDVLHDKVGVLEGTERLRRLMRERPIYPLRLRCFLAFLCSSIICTTAFGGSILDMFISGIFASILQYLGLNAAAKSAIYANVYEISVSVLVSFCARALGTISGDYFCYSAISSAGVVLILPGFTILVASLELTSRNIVCGSLRMVYAFIYTLFLGFGLTFGSDVYLALSSYGRRNLAATVSRQATFLEGTLLNTNASGIVAGGIEFSSLSGTFMFLDVTSSNPYVVKGCHRDPDWPWWRQPFPWWTLLFLVPLYTFCSSLANLQRLRSIQLPTMVLFACLSYATTKAAALVMTDRTTLISAFGAVVIGLLGNTWSRLGGGTAFTSMVTGVLFLVPSAIGTDGGLIKTYRTAAQQYSDTFELGIRMIQVAAGVTLGLFMAQITVYALGRRKYAAYFAF